MPWQVRLVDPQALAAANCRLLPGMAYFYRYDVTSPLLSPEFRALLGKPNRRQPIVIVLPDQTRFHLDLVAVKDGIPQATGWAVAGDLTAENCSLSAKPAIKSRGYHGVLAYGQLGDDLEGRTYG